MSRLSRAAVLLVVVSIGSSLSVEFTAAVMPTLDELKRKSAWFSQARVDYLPTNTGAGHATVATGTDPRAHGITGNNVYDRVGRKRYDVMEGWRPRNLAALTLADVWQLETRGRAIVLAQGSSVPAATALGGHGACQLNGVPIALAGYDQTTGRWSTNPEPPCHHRRPRHALRACFVPASSSDAGGPRPAPRPFRSFITPARDVLRT
jgi:hypothetical protein